MFVLSVQNTPTGEMPPQTVRDGEDTVGLDLEGPEAPPDPSVARRSRPIAIELPPPRRAAKGLVYTPPAPLSGRGDLPGGYFPNHEDPDRRIHRPHPFYSDVRRARNQSISLAAESSVASGSAVSFFSTSVDGQADDESHSADKRTHRAHGQSPPATTAVVSASASSRPSKSPISTTVARKSSSSSKKRGSAGGPSDGNIAIPGGDSSWSAMSRTETDTSKATAPPLQFTTSITSRRGSAAVASDSSANPPNLLLDLSPAMPGHTIAPVTAYLPTGMADAAALPLGKYYPTNYEKRKRAKREILAQQQQQRGKEHQLEKKKRKQDHYDHDHDHATDYQMPADDNTTTTIGRPSISQTSTSPHSQAGSPSSGGGGSSRNSKTTAAAGQGGSATQQELPPGSQNDAEVRRLRLLQYQRDMIAQASLAASRIVKQSGGSVAVPGTFAVAAAGSRYANASVSTHEDSATMTSTTAAGMSSSSSSSRRHRKGSSSAAPPMTLDLGSTPRANRGPPASSTLMFTGPTAFGSGAVVGEPVSPRLLPLASPGDGHPVTPMALEMERLDLGDAGRGYGSADGENEEERSDVSECDREYITSSRGGRMLNG